MCRHMPTVCIVLTLLLPAVITRGRPVDRHRARIVIHRANAPALYYSAQPGADFHLKDVSLEDAVRIRINRTRIAHLDRDALRHLPKLRRVRMNECGIAEIAPRAFADLGALESINLDDNDLKAIVYGVFNGLPVRTLRLQRNEIASIHPRAFDGMRNLHTIRLNKNHLSNIESDWFRDAPKLTKIFLKRNGISEIPAKAFAGIRANEETEIHLSSNGIRSVDEEAFEGVTVLRNLSLNNNLLSALPAGVFAHLERVDNLNLKNNRLADVDDVFPRLMEVQVLDLRGNKLTCLSHKLASVVRDVVKLNANKNIDCECLEKLREDLGRKNLPVVFGRVNECADESV